MEILIGAYAIVIRIILKIIIFENGSEVHNDAIGMYNFNSPSFDYCSFAGSALV